MNHECECGETFESSFDLTQHIRQEHQTYEPVGCKIPYPAKESSKVTKQTILDTAQRVVDGDRNLDYGRPDQNHGCTADLFEQFRRRKIQSGHDPLEFDAYDVCAFNICQKLSRLAHTFDHRDSLVDIAGYARNWEMILDSPED